jgi:hypothetical protein
MANVRRLSMKKISIEKGEIGEEEMKRRKAKMKRRERNTIISKSA